MSGLFGGGTTTFDERFGSLRIQQSSQGVGIALVWGRQRIAPNLLWFDDFKATEHRESQGGKGGGATQVSYTYEASVLMGLCAGTINGVRRIWRDKDQLTSGTRFSPAQNLNHVATVPGDRKVTVPDAARWDVDNGVRDASSGEVNITDYTVAAGVYTFGVDLVGASLSIYYGIASSSEPYSALEAAGFTQFASGARGQAVWGYLASAHAGEAIGYSGIAYVAATGLALSSSAGLMQYSFEIDARRQVSEGIPDANAADVCTDILLDPLYGAVPGAEWVGNLAHYRNWCAAMGLFLSPVYTERKGAFEYIEQIADLTFSRPLWRVDSFTVIPLATEGVSSGTGSFTPLPEHSAPVYVITDDDISEPIEEQRKAPADRYNRVNVQFKDRAADYAEAIETAEDKAAIDAFGLIPEPNVFHAPEIAVQSVAAIVAQLRLRQGLSVQGTYKFNLPVNFDLLDPLDIISISDARIDLDIRSVRITEIKESSDGALSIIAEDVEITGAVTQASQPSGGFVYGPGVIDATLLRAVLMPTAATNNVQQVWVGATAGANWGGATLWVSETGTDYRRVGVFTVRARLGALSHELPGSLVELDTSHELQVGVLGDGAPLPTVSQADVDSYRSLIWADGELLAYRDAELTGVRAYDLGYLCRGLYGTDADVHDVGTSWMRLDEAVLRLDVPAALIGKTMYLKATGRGLLGTVEQGLDEVSPLVLDVVAQQSKPGASSVIALTSPFVSTYFEINFAAAARAFEYQLEVRHAGVLLRAVSTSAQVFRYLYADAVDDGGALREYQVRVRGVNDAGAGPWASIVVSNPAPAAVEGVAESGTGDSRTLTWDPNVETDRAGYRAWISEIEDFDPKAGEGTQIYDGSATTAEATSLLAATTYYVRVAAYDVWSAITADLNLSDQFTFET